MPDAGTDTIVGNDVWIGQGARILPGAVIGDGVIIGAGAVVSGRIPDYAVIAGNPATIKRMRFDEKTILKLRELKWWHWPIEDVIALEKLMVGGDIEALIAASPK